MKTVRLASILTLLVLTSLACVVSDLGSLGDIVGSDVQDVIEAAENVADAAEDAVDSLPSDSSNGATVDLDNPDLYLELEGSNYTVEMNFNFTGVNPDGSPLYREIVLTGQRNIDPPASYFRMDPNDPAVMDGIEFMEIADIDGTDYVYVAGQGCSVFGNNEYNNPYDSLADTGGVLTGEATRIGTETVNGVQTDVYAITVDNLDPNDAIFDDISELQEGRLYVAQGDGHVVRLLLGGRGMSELLTSSTTLEGDVAYQLDFTPTSEQFDIRPPEDCQAQMETSEYPFLPDALNISSFPGLFSYITASTPAEVLDFYKTEMAALGYTVGVEFSVEGLSSLEFNDGNGTISLIATANLDGTTSVVIASAP